MFKQENYRWNFEETSLTQLRSAQKVSITKKLPPILLWRDKFSVVYVRDYHIIDIFCHTGILFLVDPSWSPLARWVTLLLSWVGKAKQGKAIQGKAQIVEIIVILCFLTLLWPCSLLLFMWVNPWLPLVLFWLYYQMSNYFTIYTV